MRRASISVIAAFIALCLSGFTDQTVATTLTPDSYAIPAAQSAPGFDSELNGEADQASGKNTPSIEDGTTQSGDTNGSDDEAEQATEENPLPEDPAGG